MIIPYAVIISLSLAFIMLFNALFSSVSVLLCVLYTMVNFFVVFGADLLIAVIIDKIPKHYFDYNSKFFTVSKKELKFYSFVGIKKWKKYVPDVGNFKKGKLQTVTNDYIKLFLHESCVGEVVHILCVLASLINFAFYNLYFLNFALPVMLVNAILNLPPIFIQRYNRPKLLRVYKMRLKEN